MAVIDILPPEPAAKHARRVQRAGGSVVDADFITVGSRSCRAPRFAGKSGTQAPRSAGTPSVSSPASSLQQVEQSLSRLPADMFSAVVALVFLIVFGLSGGFSFFIGQGGGAAPDHPLDFTHVTLTPQDENGLRVLLINGIIENRGGANLPLPSIRADFVSDGSLLSTAMIEPPVVEIQARHSHGFTARIPHPGGKMPELKLSFAGKGASRS